LLFVSKGLIMVPRRFVWVGVKLVGPRERRPFQI
jgi:hypothetical protein